MKPSTGLLLLLLFPVSAPAQSIPEDEALQAFATARNINARDAGRLWGMPVCGPILFVDPSTRDVAANQQDREERLKGSGPVWRGRLPDEIGIANTATKWSGTDWTMVMWPLPQDSRSRAKLLAHECYHRIQPDLRLPAPGANAIATHLDSKEGRIWMLLEWRALERALVEQGPARVQAVADALRFRGQRRSLFKDAAANEIAREIGEGLAEDTGVKIANSNPADRRAAAIYGLRDGPGRSSLVRSFAYASSPAYGVLLDEAGVNWRKGLRAGSDLGDLLAHACGLRPDTRDALRVARGYGGEDVMALESLRSRKHELLLATKRRAYIEGPVLILPVMNNFSYSFDPNGLLPLEESSVLYRQLRVTDSWGILDADGGLVVREGGPVRRIVVPAPTSVEARKLSGDGWIIVLNPGFQVVPGARKGDFVLEKK